MAYSWRQHEDGAGSYCAVGDTSCRAATRASCDDRHGKFVFPSVRTSTRCMSENTVNAALRGIGYGKDVMTGHGFRAMARTIIDEVLGERVDLIEHQLAHAVKDPNGRAYNRTAHLPARRLMMQRWADYLDSIKQNHARILCD